MELFYIQQSKTYKAEFAGEYVWTPQRASNGGPYYGYNNMSLIKRGDVLFHAVDGFIKAVSVVTEGCYAAPMPEDHKGYTYTNDGYRVDSKYYHLQSNVNARDYREWFDKHYVPQTAFEKGGYGGARVTRLADSHAAFLIKEILKTETNKDARKLLMLILARTGFEEEYTEPEKEIVDNLIGEDLEWPKPKGPSPKKKQDTTTPDKKGLPTPRRDPRVAAAALSYAQYKCEYEPTDRTFKRKSGKPYTEPHHLIPISRYCEYEEMSLDVYENIVSLCSHCHNLLHYGAMDEKEPVLRKLYEDRKDMLAAYGIEISYEELKEYYK